MKRVSLATNVKHTNDGPWANWSTGTGFVALAVLLANLAALVHAQPPEWRHLRHSADMEPGAVGRDQLSRGGPLQGYFQPVKIIAPEGSSISLVIEGRFDDPQPAPLTVGMLIGEVYRLKVTGIPGSEGFEVFPTIEVVSRLFPPRGEKARFAVPVHLTTEELEMAVAGLYVTRVVYLEDPTTALPVHQDPGLQPFFEVLPGADPLRTADELGRPMAILRMGSRFPESLTVSNQFVYGSPPLIKYNNPEQKPVVRELKSVEPAAGGHIQNRTRPANQAAVRSPEDVTFDDSIQR